MQGALNVAKTGMTAQDTNLKVISNNLANVSTVGFKKDNAGNTVLTKLDDKTLKEIALYGNGKYFRGTNYDDHLDKIYTELSEMEESEFGVKKVTDYEDRFYYFLIPAILLLTYRVTLS